jgi:hypothetical protein
VEIVVGELAIFTFRLVIFVLIYYLKTRTKINIKLSSVTTINHKTMSKLNYFKLFV